MTKEGVKTGLEVAVIGMAGRFPGAPGIDIFWDNLRSGVESISFFSQKELEGSGINPLWLDSNYVRARGILDNADCFDAGFFGYSPHESILMDPQIRIFHECCWEALEHAGYNPEACKGNIGLYAGASANYYWHGLTYLSGNMDLLDPFSANLLVNKDYLTTQVSFRFNFRGPSFSVQTACSTSLVAIHLACQGLISGDCTMALAGGVSVSVPFRSGYLYQEGMVKSPDGHCRAFDAAAGGFASGDGVGLVVLKLLEDAIAHGDYIHALVKGTAINNDGRQKVGFTAPGIKGQATVIKAALEMAEIEPESITYIETHGTGTLLGDQIEIEALKRVFAKRERNSVKIGSVKTNIGHLDAAAGVASFIKTVLALKNRQIPPSIHFNTPDPKMDLDNSPFQVNTQLVSWENEKYPLRAGVSSFGIGGTNVHAVLEEAAAQSTGHQTQGAKNREERQLILVSALTPSTLADLTGSLAKYFKENPHVNLADAAFTLQVGRKPLKYRRMLLCSGVDEAARTLSLRLNHRQPDSMVEEKKRVVFMFAGLGSQYVNMGRELYRQVPHFREDMDRCFEILKPLTDCDIKEILYPHSDCRGGFPYPPHDGAGSPGQGDNRGLPLQSDQINQTEIAQIVIFIFEYALARLLMKWGITPDAMMGYSFGEYTVACLAGVFSLEDMLKIVVYRGKLLRQAPSGSLLSVPLPYGQIIPLMANDLSVAIDNGSSCIIAGPPGAVDCFENRMKTQRLMCMPLKNTTAVHSAMMDPLLPEFRQFLETIRGHPPEIPYISNLTGKWITVEDALRPGYWTDHMRKTVRFSDGIKELTREPGSIFIEIGPGRDLSAIISRFIHEKQGQHVVNLAPTPGQQVSDMHYLVNKLGQIWLYGVNINWQAFHSPEKRHRIPLPVYPFQGKPYRVREKFPDQPVQIWEKESPSRMRRKTDISDWFYIPSWKRSVLLSPSPEARSRSCCWLFFPDRHRLADSIKKRLEKEGHNVITVIPGPEFVKKGDRQYCINPQNSRDYQLLFQELAQSGILPERILHLWSVNPPGAHRKNTAGLWNEQVQYKGFYSLIYLVKALVKQHINQEIRLEVITSNVCKITGDEVICPERAVILGPVKVIPQEYPFIISRHIDILVPEPGSPGEQELSDRLYAELTTPAPDTVVAYRGGLRWVQVFDPLQLRETHRKPPLLKEKGVYLITGGTGSIGLMLARYLVKSVKGKLILVSRSGLPPRQEWEQRINSPQGDAIARKIEAITELEKAGGEVLVMAADVSNRQQMGDVVSRARQRFGRIHGVIHAAGDTGDSIQCPIEHLDHTLSQRQFKPKINGLLVLEEIFQDSKPEFCLLISSLAPILGGLGFSAYSAANFFMDAFVRQFGSNCSPRWISINWAEWQRENLAGDNELLISEAEGITTFERILTHSYLKQVIVSSGDLQARIDRWVHLSTLRREDRTGGEESLSTQARPNLLTPYIPPRTHLQQALVEIWKSIFGYEQIGIQDDFLELGGDSLKAILTISRIRKHLDLQVSLVAFFDRPTIEALSQHLSTAQKDRYISIPAAEKKEYYPLSSTQKRFYIIQQMNHRDKLLNMPELVRMEGNLNPDRLEGAFKALIARHETLRTSFCLTGNEVVQKIHPGVKFSIEYFHGSQEEIDPTVDTFIRPFDLNAPPLLRVGLMKLEEQKHLLLVDMHHIISDGISHQLLKEDFLLLYAGKDLLPLRLQYKDYSEWWNSQKHRETLKLQEDYWIKEFENPPPLAELPVDYSRKTITSFEGSMIKFNIDKEVTKTLKKMSAEEATSLFILLLAGFNVLIAKLSQQEDIVVGTVISGRNHVDLEGIIGSFVNLLALRNFPRAEKTFKEFLREVKQKTLASFENQDYQFEDLVDKLIDKRESNRFPLLNVGFTMQNLHMETGMPPGFDLPELKFIQYQYQRRSIKLDLNLEVYEWQDQLFFSLVYCNGLFKEETILEFGDYFKKIITEIIENSMKRIKEMGHYIRHRDESFSLPENRPREKILVEFDI